MLGYVLPQEENRGPAAQSPAAGRGKRWLCLLKQSMVKKKKQQRDKKVLRN